MRGSDRRHSRRSPAAGHCLHQRAHLPPCRRERPWDPNRPSYRMTSERATQKPDGRMTSGSRSSSVSWAPFPRFACPQQAHP